MNINQRRSTRSVFLSAILAAATWLTSPVLAQQEQGIVQRAGGKVYARHVVGLDNIKRNSTVSLIVHDGELEFQAQKMNANLALGSIDDISVGTETTRAGGRAGTLAKTAAMAAPYDSGPVLSILLRTTGTRLPSPTGIRMAVCITQSWLYRKAKASSNALS
jgi:hypothetical protein